MPPLELTAVWYVSGLYEKGFVEISGVTPQAIDAVTSMPVVHPESD